MIATTSSFIDIEVMQFVFLLYFKKNCFFVFVCCSAARPMLSLSIWDCFCFCFVIVTYLLRHTLNDIFVTFRSSSRHTSKETKKRAFTRYSEQGSRVVAHHLSVPNFYRRASWRTAGRSPYASTCRSATAPRRRCAETARSCSGWWSREPVNPNSPVTWRQKLFII